MHFFRLISILGALLLVGASTGCFRKGFDPNRFQDPQALFQASLQQLQQRRWDAAIRGFERLTLQLPARDPLLPRALYYLGQAHQGKKEFLLAAQSFTRVAEGFPEDTLADDALLAAGRSYARLWTDPALDPQYGEAAITTFQTLLALYPNSELRDEAEGDIGRIQQRLAEKVLDTGEYYLRRKAYDSAIIYLKDVVRLYPETPQAKRALLRMLQAYGEIRYREDVAETCEQLRTRYPQDPEVRQLCPEAPQTAATPPPAAPSLP